ncbi:MAG: hypothetical protein DRJ47_11480 [Thermoprotei archaeon]|nr:MAG: hypothetical protein DRJ47_11480 [Thermoprotei archaeon]
MSDYQLGPCKVEIDGADMGKTEGGVTLTINDSSVVLHTDQDGETPVDEVITGKTVTVTGALSEVTLEHIATVLNASVTGAGASKKIEITPGVGTSLLSNSVQMILTPYVDGSPSSAANDKITIHKAGLKAAIDMAYNRSDQRVVNFEAVGYPDSSQSDVIITFGDTAAAS